MTVVLRAGLLVDGHGDDPVPNPLIEIGNGLIRSVSSGQLPESSELNLVDLGEVTIIPGLIDAHVHLSFSCEENSREAFVEASDEDLLAKARANARIHLEAGVTTVRECGGRGDLMIRLSREIDAGDLSLPRILPSGAPICVERGHLWFMGGEVRGIDDIERAIHGQIDRGAHYIKITSTGGSFTPGTDLTQASFSLDEMRAAVNAAHSRGVHIGSHAHGAPGIRNSVEAGVDTVEHCTWVSPSGSIIEPDVLRALVESDCWVAPTMGNTLRHSRDAPEKAAKRRPIASSWTSTLENVAEMIGAGVRMIAGTDSGMNPIAFHGSIANELSAMHLAGLSGMDAIKSATEESARALRVADSIGSIRPGLRADLVALDSNPLDDIEALADVQLVFRNGRPVAGPRLKCVANAPNAPDAWRQP